MIKGLIIYQTLKQLNPNLLRLVSKSNNLISKQFFALFLQITECLHEIELARPTEQKFEQTAVFFFFI